MMIFSLFHPAHAGTDAVNIGFETGDWQGAELTSDQVKTGSRSARWKDHLANRTLSTGNIPHDWTAFDSVRLWIFNEGPTPTQVMLVLTSGAPSGGFSYFGYRLNIDWNGWKPVEIPLSYFEPNRDPAGWHQIDSIMFTAEGWGMKPSAAASLYLDGLELTKTSVKPASAAELAVMEKIKKQFCDYQSDVWKNSPKFPGYEKLVRTWAKSLTPDGAWPDVNYADATRGYWRTTDHITRLNRMCQAYTTSGGPLQGDQELLAAIHSALGHWLKMDYRNPNWWHNEIGVPLELGTVLLLIEPELTPQERATGLRIVSRSVIDSPPHGGRGVLTGQNRVWVAANALLGALLSSNYELARHARDVIFEEVTIATQDGGQKPIITATSKPGEILHSTQEGIQPDFSFFQHGPMLQLGNYGLAFAGDAVTWLTVFQGTTLAPEPEKISIIRDYLLEGETPVVWKGRMDISSCGRQLGPKSPAGKGASVLRILANAKAADPAHAAAYQAAIDHDEPDAKNIPPQNVHFWRADYIVHRRPTYYASTRMSSSRVLATELVNGENLQGTYSGDGVTFVYLAGDEYEDIFPVWDWSRLPGVTSPTITDKAQLKPQNNKFTNPSDFVGGVSDGTCGLAAMTLNRDGLTAKKSVFFFDDEIVALGAGLSNPTDARPITSSINQNLRRGEIRTDQGTAKEGIAAYNDLKWAWHDQVGYVFPESLPLRLGSQQQEGKWIEISSGGKNQDAIAKDVFSLWVAHGVNPRDARYSYILLPGASPEETGKFARNPSVAILSNTPSLQAVRHQGLKLVQAVFYETGTLDCGGGSTIAVDKPCALLFHETDKKLVVSDPTQQTREITITLNGKSAIHTLPSGARAGSSLTISEP